MRLQRRLQQQLESLHWSAEVGGASDGNFAAAAGARVLDGLGAVGGGAHAPNEWVKLSSIEERSAFLHALIKELLA